MYMKTHMLAALREEFGQWENVLASLTETQITTPPQPGELSLKDEIAHLWAWQQRSIARLEAGVAHGGHELVEVANLGDVDVLDEAVLVQVVRLLGFRHGCLQQGTVRSRRDVRAHVRAFVVRPTKPVP